MAKRKYKRATAKKRRNATAAASGGQRMMMVPYKKANPAKRRHHHVKRAKRRNPAARRNPARRSNPGILGIAIMPLVAGGISAALVQTVSNAIPFGTPGSLGELAKDGVLVFLVHKFWPKSFYPQAAVVGAAAIPIAAAVNTFLPGVSNTISSTIRSFVPNGLLSAPPNNALAGPTGVMSSAAGMAGYPTRRFRYA